jgi:hypothetical protein
MSMMFYIGPAIGILVTVGTLFFVFRLLGGLAKAKKEEARILSTGAPAQGQIMAVQQTGTYVNNNPQVVIVVQVTPQGGQPYQTQITKVVSMFEIPQFQVGTAVSLRIDPMNPMNVAIAGGLQAGMPQGMPQQQMPQGMPPQGMPQGMPPQQMQQPGMPPQQMQQPGMPPQQMQQPGAPPQQGGYPQPGQQPQQPGLPPQQGGGWPGGRPPNG